MNMRRKSEIGRVVETALGTDVALAVLSALDIAWREWTPEYDRKYGTIVAKLIVGD